MFVSAPCRMRRKAPVYPSLELNQRMLRFTLARTALRNQLRPQIYTGITYRDISVFPFCRDKEWGDFATTPVRQGEGKFGHHHERRFFNYLPMIILPFVPIVCLGLGAWQMKRLHWKVNLIDDIQDKLQRAAIKLPRNVK